MLKIFSNKNILLMIIILSLILGGSYFVYASALLSILLFIYLIAFLHKKTQIKIALDYNFITLCMLPLGYLITCLWAIDSGMAFFGFIKYLPIVLFFLVFIQNYEEKNKIIRYLPALGSCMTIFSFLMMQYPIFSQWVSVAGRLSGFFQYPNTYALFLLICLIISYFEFEKEKFDWLTIANILIALFGIYKSGSRTVFILTIFSFAVIFFKKKKKLFMIISLSLVIILIGIIFLNKVIDLPHIFNISLNASTFLGRILYCFDSLPLMIKHPFGLGYYGYYFMQPEIQTGVYSVVNVHNELFQFILDIGVIPGALIYVCFVRSIWVNRINIRDSLILTVIVLHSLLDFDFQFISIIFVLILFLDIKNIRSVYLHKYEQVIPFFAFVLSLYSICSVGLSDYYYMMGNYNQALKARNSNTMAKIQKMISIDDSADDMEYWADSILETNKHIAVAYNVKALVAFERGNIENFIKMKTTAIHLAPYHFNEYVEYVEALMYCANHYLEINDKSSAELCVKRAESVIEELEMVKRKTSYLGWRIDQIPRVTLPYEILEKIEEMREKLNE